MNNAQYFSNSLQYVYEPEIGQRIQYTGSTTTSAVISVANPNLDGSGTIYTVATGSGFGTLIKTITIKALGNTTKGMVRFYIDNGSTYDLVMEVEVPAVIATSVDEAFYICLETDFMLRDSYNLNVSTEKAESFMVRAEALDISFP